MTYTFNIPMDAVFFLWFAGGFIAGFAVLWMMIDYARMRAEYNCMGVKRTTPGRPKPPKPDHNPNK